MRRSLPAFFNELGEAYTHSIRKCVPRYDEMLWALLHYLPDDLEPGRILELGCGTGNLTVLLANRYPMATIQVVDAASDLLEVCRRRLADHEVAYDCRDFADLDENESDYDLVVSSIALHHLKDGQKRQLFQRLYDCLSLNGWLAYSDQFSAPRRDVYQKHIAAWRQQAECDASEWSDWMSHQQDHDHHAPLLDQLTWLRDAGFSDVDCVWRHLLWTVVQGRKND